MRTMLKISMPNDAGNKAIKDGTMSKNLEALLNDLKPEASYFFPENGRRAAIFVFDMKTQSQLAEIGEQVWLNMGADVAVFPVMNAEDLKAGLQTAMKKSGRTPVAA